MLIRRILILVSFFTSYTNAQHSNWDILMNEPVSLLDLTIFKAEIEGAAFANNELPKAFSKFSHELSWILKPNSASLPLPKSKPSFNFTNKTFEFQYDFLMPIPDKEDYKELDIAQIYYQEGLLKPTKENYSNLCTKILKASVKGISFHPMTHAGYTTKTTRELPSKSKLFVDALKNSIFRVKFEITSREMLKGTRASFPTIICEANKKDLFESNLNISYKFSGKWEQLKEYY